MNQAALFGAVVNQNSKKVAAPTSARAFTKRTTLRPKTKAARLALRRSVAAISSARKLLANGAPPAVARAKAILTSQASLLGQIASKL